MLYHCAGKASLCGKRSQFGKPINQYLSDSHVFGGVNEVMAVILCGGPICSSTNTQSK